MCEEFGCGSSQDGRDDVTLRAQSWRGALSETGMHHGAGCSGSGASAALSSLPLGAQSVRSKGWRAGSEISPRSRGGLARDGRKSWSGQEWDSFEQSVLRETLNHLQGEQTGWAFEGQLPCWE